MISKSKRAERMERHYRRNRSTVMLNLVSLMDIFTILVFFLLVNSTDVEILPSAKDIQIPESVAKEKPRETVVVMITDENLLVQGKIVASVDEIMRSRRTVIPRLREALRRQTDRILQKQLAEDIAGREVTIVGDKEIPYALLKKVMATCTDADYGKISLAVMQKTVEPAV